ncbi:MAG: hypothetical protein M3Y87_23140 [Myxococcota bacterium]|nr:hypothetical protein [Myxococcota bacterium]
MDDRQQRGGYRAPARPASGAAELRQQQQLDEHFGVTAADRAVLERGRVPLRLRARSALHALGWLTIPLAASTFFLAAIARGEGSWTLLCPAAMMASMALMAVPHARAAIDATCEVSEGAAEQYTFDDRPVQHYVRIGLVSVRMSRALGPGVDEGDLVRAYYCPRRLELYALERLGGPPPEHPRSDRLRWWSDSLIDDFRRELH